MSPIAGIVWAEAATIVTVMAENRPFVGSVALRNDYQPWILTGHRSGLPPGGTEPLACYLLWFVSAGCHTISTGKRSWRVAAPGGLLLQPGGSVSIVTSSRSAWRRIDFDLCHRQRQPEGSGPGLAAGTPPIAAPLTLPDGRPSARPRQT